MNARNALAQAQAGMEQAFRRQLEEAPPRFTGRHFDTVDLDLSLPGWSSPALTQPGFGVYFIRNGSEPDAILDLESNGLWAGMVPGDFARGMAFDGLMVRRNPNSVQSGNARLLILRNPNVEAGQSPQSPSGGLGGGAVGPGGAATQSTADDNAPTAVTDGVSLSGVRAVRLVVSAAAGQTLSGGGTVELWHYNASRARWCRVDVEFSMATLPAAATFRDWIFPDQPIDVPEGRLYARARTVTASGGALTISLETY